MQKPDIVILARRFKHEDTPWNEISEKIKSLGAKKVIVLEPVLQFKGDLPTLVARKYMENDYISTNNMDQSIFETNVFVENIERKNFIYINLVNSLCDKNKCLVKTKRGDNFSLISFDYGHLSNHGSEFIVNKFLKSYIDAIYNK